MARHGRAFPLNRVYKRPILIVPAGTARSFGYIFCWLIMLLFSPAEWSVNGYFIRWLV